jgi:protein TonB
MTKDIDLTSQKWLDLIFEGKNHEYGAYVLREESPKRHLRAVVIVAVVALTAIFLPRIISQMVPAAAVIEEVTEVSMIDINQDVPEENQIKEIENVPPPPLLKETVQFTPPVIDKDENVNDDQLMKTQEELTETKAAISVADVKGVTDGGVDIADLQEHKVVVQEEEKIWEHVEQKPSFPGGEKEMLKWLYDNIVYPAIAQEQGIQGLVVVRFVVGKDGSITSAEIARSLDPSCDKEALRVVKKMPKWIPGKQNGTAVMVRYTLPVRFRLQN